jgi:hypothetical protein
MNTFSLTLWCISGFALVASAQTAAELKIKQPSEFDARTAIHDPFWPVGWQKAAPVPQTGAASAAATALAGANLLKPESFVVTSISTGALPLAVINGKAYGEGELINIGGAPTGSVQVFAIRDGVVILRSQNQTITVYIREKR